MNAFIQNMRPSNSLREERLDKIKVIATVGIIYRELTITLVE